MTTNGETEDDRVLGGAVSVLALRAEMGAAARGDAVTIQEWRRSPWSLTVLTLTWAFVMHMSDGPLWFTCAVAFFLPHYWRTVFRSWKDDE